MTFAGIAGERVSMNIGFVPTACCTVNVSILNPNGTRLVNPIAVASGQVLMDAKTLPTTGTYTIVVILPDRGGNRHADALRPAS